MDVNLAARVSCLAAAVLATGVRPVAAAENAAGAEPPAMVVVTATDAEIQLQQPLAISSSQGNSPRQKMSAPRAPREVAAKLQRSPAQSDLSVVANPTRKGLLAGFLGANASAAEADAEMAIIVDDQVHDASADQVEDSAAEPVAKGLLAKWTAKRSGAEVVENNALVVADDEVEQSSYIYIHSDDAEDGQHEGATDSTGHDRQFVGEQVAQFEEPVAQGQSSVDMKLTERKLLANGRRTTTNDPAHPRSARIAAAPAHGTDVSDENSLWGNLLGGPRRPAEAAGIRTGQRGNRSVSPEPGREPRQMYSQLDASDEPQRAVAAMPRRPEAPTPKSTDPAGELLIHAYELSLAATTEAEYSQIVRWCADATRQGVADDSREFALELSAWAINRRGQLRCDDGQSDLALADFRAALEFDAENWRALHNRGVINAQSGHFAEAFDDVSRVIQLNPDFAKAYSNRATLYVQAGNFDAAAADYERALELDETLVPALVGRGRVYHMAGRRDEALASFDKALNLKPEDAEIVCSRGDLLSDMGRYRDALEDYAKAIDLNPHLEHAYRNGAWLLATCPDDTIRDSEGALKGAKAALDCGYGERHAALDTLAAALANAGQYEEAVGTIQQAIEIAPAEAKQAYAARQQLYEARQPFRTWPVGGVEAAAFEDDGDAAVEAESIEAIEVISDQ